MPMAHAATAIGLAMPGYAIYAATKAAVETFTNILAKELRGRQITVNAIAPGPTATQFFFQGKAPDEGELIGAGNELPSSGCAGHTNG